MLDASFLFVCFLSENSLKCWDLVEMPENQDLVSVLISWIFCQNSSRLRLVFPFVENEGFTQGKRKGSYSFEDAYILIPLEPSGAIPGLPSRTRKEGPAPACTAEGTIDKLDDTFQKRGQAIWEIHAGMSLQVGPGNSYLQDVEGAEAGQAYIWCQIHNGHSS